MQTIDQRYADVIRKQVVAIKKEKEEEYKKYGAMAHKLPLLIYSAGLLQALEFVNSRGDAIQQRLLDHLATTLQLGTTSEELLTTIRSTDIRGYMRLTRQALAALLWYKR